MATLSEFLTTHKHRLPTIALLVGFVFDIVTFKTLNLFYAQIILVAHLTIVASTILFSIMPRGESGGVAGKFREWVPILQQYSTGNLLSAYLILYGGSGSLSQSWPFYAMLLFAVIGNEVLTREKYRLPFATTLFFLNILLFFTLALPIATGSISTLSFLLAIVAGTVVFQIFRWLLSFAARSTFAEYRTSIRRGALATLAVLSVLYFTNLIPPIPLTIKDVGFYHHVAREGDVYVVEGEVRRWFEIFFDVRGANFSITPDQRRVYVYSAVFAPAAIDTTVVHRWEYFDSQKEEWAVRNVVRFPLEGGRRLGYRAYSYVDNPSLGRWRVSVETTRGAVIGQSYVTIEEKEFSVPTRLETKE